MNSFYYTVDSMTYDAIVAFKIKNPDLFINSSKRKRCGLIVEIAHSLIKPCIDYRYQCFRIKNFSFIHQDLRKSFDYTNACFESSIFISFY